VREAGADDELALEAGGFDADAGLDDAGLDDASVQSASDSLVPDADVPCNMFTVARQMVGQDGVDCNHDRVIDTWMIQYGLMDLDNLDVSELVYSRCLERAAETGRGGYIVSGEWGFDSYLGDAVVVTSDGNWYHLPGETYGTGGQDYTWPAGRYFCGHVSELEDGFGGARCYSEDAIWSGSVCSGSSGLLSSLDRTCTPPEGDTWLCDENPGLEPAPLGSRCDTSADCETGDVCESRFPSEPICTRSCADADCPAGAQCVTDIHFEYDGASEP
jgi:hypothetical protein